MHGDEDETLVACALRFDGYRYLDDHPFDHSQALDDFYRTGEWRLSQLEQLAVFFMLQRFLYKWGGEMLARTSAVWRAFRSLFLLVYKYEIPERFRHHDYFDAWVQDYVPTLVERAALIRRIHEDSNYSDGDVVEPSALP